MIPLNTDIANVIHFLIDKFPSALFKATATEIQITDWDEAIPQPTDQEIIDAGNDLTTVNGQVFSQWLAEHGGDAILTSRREAKEALDQATSRIESLIRAIALITMDEINILRQQFNDSTAESNQLTTTAYTQRTAAQIKTAIRNKIDSGDADT